MDGRQEVIKELRAIRNSTWKVAKTLNSFQSGASINGLVEKTYEKVIFKLDAITFDGEPIKKQRHIWEKKTEK